MKITGIELDAVHVNHRGDWIFVHVLTDEGLRGLGELRAGRNYEDGVAAVRELADGIKARDPLQIEQLVAAFKSPNQNRICALSAIEQALWDILGKAVGKPVYSLLGGKRQDQVRLFKVISRTDPDVMAARVADGLAQNVPAGRVDRRLDIGMPLKKQIHTVIDAVQLGRILADQIRCDLGNAGACAFGVGSEHSDDRKLIDGSRRQPSRHLGCRQTHPGHRDHTNRVSVDRTGDLGLHLRSHTFQNR